MKVNSKPLPQESVGDVAEEVPPDCLPEGCATRISTSLASLPAVDSWSLLEGRKMVNIRHGDQYYVLRVTRENKLILTK